MRPTEGLGKLCLFCVIHHISSHRVQPGTALTTAASALSLNTHPSKMAMFSECQNHTGPRHPTSGKRLLSHVDTARLRVSRGPQQLGCCREQRSRGQTLIHKGNLALWGKENLVWGQKERSGNAGWFTQGKVPSPCLEEDILIARDGECTSG